MSKFSIQIEGGSLDLYKQDISWEWTNIRFADGIRDPYSTDIDIPKTMNNMNLLGISGLLDSSSQLFGTQIKPCVLCLNGEMMDVYLQVVAITDDIITICIYEKLISNDVRDMEINDVFIDNQSSIYRWNKNSLAEYPNAFRKYVYGTFPYNPKYAQLHPSRQINLLIASLNSVLTDTVLPIAWNGLSLNAVATNKKVCPQNRIQVVEMNDTDMNGNVFLLHGGQHITNELGMGNGDASITFNRMTFVNLKVWVCWRKKSATTQNKECLMKVNGANYWHFPIPSGNTDTGCEIYQLAYQFNQGDELSFECPDTDRLDYVSLIVRMEHGGYGITSDDYGSIDLEYTARLPELRVKGTVMDTYLPMDGNNHAVHHNNGSLTQFQTENLSFAYFGYYCNLPKITVGNLLNGICWINGMKLVKENGVLQFKVPNDTAIIKNGQITEISPMSERLGQKNHVLFTNEDRSSSNLVSTIPNVWLETEHDFHVSPFAYSHPTAVSSQAQTLKILQYSNPEYDSETNEYKCDFDEVEGLTIGLWNGYELEPVSIQTMGLEKLTQSMECSITSKDDGLSDVDYVYLDGRKFMVVEGNTDLNNNDTSLTCLLVPPQTP